MNDPKPWNEDSAPPPPELGSLIERGRAVKQFAPALQARVWRDIERAATRPAGFDRRWALVPLSAAIAAAVALVAVQLWPKAPAASRRVNLGAVAELEVGAGAVCDIPPLGSPSADGYRMSVEFGRVCAHVAHRDIAREGAFIVEAPRLRVEVVGTRFCVEVTSEQSAVSVTEGRVRVSRPGLAERLVSAGEALTSDRLPALAPAPVPVPAIAAPESEVEAPRLPVAGSHPATVSDCAANPSLARRADCYAGFVGGDDLAAQNALFALALLNRNQLHDGPAALSFLHTYLARYPKGTLAPEAHQTLILELAAEAKRTEAVGEAEHYLRTYGWDGRAAEVALLRANLLVQAGDRAVAVAAYRDLLQHSAPAEVAAQARAGLSALGEH